MEGPRLLVTYGVRRTAITQKRMVQRICAVIKISRPLFVAFELERVSRHRQRGQTLSRAIQEACTTCGVMCLPVKSAWIYELTDYALPTKWRIAQAISKLFPELAVKLPPRRCAWLPEDPRVGLFLAVAAAVVAWESFPKSRW